MIGSDNRSAILMLLDTNGRPRIRLAVDSSDVARLEFLNGEGDVVRSLSDEPPNGGEPGEVRSNGGGISL